MEKKNCVFSTSKKMNVINYHGQLNKNLITLLTKPRKKKKKKKEALDFIVHHNKKTS